jgi:hypothetical protein
MHLVPMGTASECEWKHGGAVFLSNPTVKDAFPGAYRRRSSILEAYRQRPLDWDRPPHGSGAAPLETERLENPAHARRIGIASTLLPGLMARATQITSGWPRFPPRPHVFVVEATSCRR